MSNTGFIMNVCFLQPRQVPLEALLAFPSLDRLLHRREVRR